MMHVVLGLEVFHGQETTQDQNSDCTIATPSLMTVPVFDWVAYLGPMSVLLHCFFPCQSYQSVLVCSLLDQDCPECDDRFSEAEEFKCIKSEPSPNWNLQATLQAPFHVGHVFV